MDHIDRVLPWPEPVHIDVRVGSRVYLVILGLGDQSAESVHDRGDASPPAFPVASLQSIPWEIAYHGLPSRQASIVSLLGDQKAGERQLRPEQL